MNELTKQLDLIQKLIDEKITTAEYMGEMISSDKYGDRHDEKFKASLTLFFTRATDYVETLFKELDKDIEKEGYKANNQYSSHDDRLLARKKHNYLSVKKMYTEIDRDKLTTMIYRVMENRDYYIKTRM